MRPEFGPPFVTVPLNRHGRDFCIGDLHGCWEMLHVLLNSVKFDRQRDRLFSTGDLIHLGPDSLTCLLVAEKPWFRPVLGAAEAMQWEAFHRADHWSGWPLGLFADPDDIDENFRNYANTKRLLRILAGLPLAIEVPLRDGRRVGITHAGVGDPHDWNMVRAIEERKAYLLDLEDPGLQTALLWDRSIGDAIAMSVEPEALRRLRRATALERLEVHWASQPVSGIDLLVSGHVSTRHGFPVKAGMRVLLDTGAGRWNGTLTLMELETGRCWNVMARPPPASRVTELPLVMGDPEGMWLSPGELRKLERSLGLPEKGA